MSAMPPVAPMDPTAPFLAGVETANQTPEKAEAEAPELASVKKWFKKIKHDRKFDEVARTNYARSRRYARGDAGSFEVNVPIAQSYIDVLHSMIYAKDPNLDVNPTSLTEPPPVKEIESMVLAKQGPGQGQPGMPGQPAGPGAPGATPPMPGPVRAMLMKIAPGMFANGQDPSPEQVQSVMGGAGAPPPGMGAGSPPPGMGAGGPPMGPPGAPPPPQLSPEQQMAASVNDILAPYQKKRDDAKQFAETLEIVVAAQWEKAKLKMRMKMVVKSALTIGPGWMKAMWLERQGKDPITEAAISDVQQQLASIAATKAAMNDQPSDMDELKDRLQQQMDSMKDGVDIVIARGFAVDFVSGEDIQVSSDVARLADYLDAGYIAQRCFKTREDCAIEYPDKVQEMRQATVYLPIKPKDNTSQDTGSNDANINAEEADSYTASSANTSTNEVSGGGYQATSEATGAGKDEDFLCIWEVQDKLNGMVLTIMEGVKCYLRAPMPPDPPTTRFYTLFMYSIGNIDGQRHPRSMTDRSAKLFDEYNRTRSAYARHRRRAIPKTVYDRSNLSDKEVAKVESATALEMIGLKVIRPGEPMASTFQSLAYPAVDPALYDTRPIMAELETIWGVQQALGSGIMTAKTATESEIQDKGTNSRTSYMMDDADFFMEDLAQYSSEVFLQKLTQDDVEEIAGPWALWPEGMTIDDMHALVTIKIEAGSTGKPDTSAQRQAWAILAPALTQQIQQIGQLRGSSPEEIADCLEQVVIETVKRAGDHADARNFLPDAPRTPPPPPPKPPAPPMADSALMGPQIAALEQVGVSVRGGLLLPAGALALCQMSAPSIPVDLIKAFIDGCLPQPNDPATQIASRHVQTTPPVTPPAAAAATS